MILTADLYRTLRARLAALGYVGDWEWAQNVRGPETPEALICEYTWVVINSGMKHTIARKIMDRVWPALIAGTPLSTASTHLADGKIFGHRGKVAALERGWRERGYWHLQFQKAVAASIPDVLAWCEALPWIGKITKFHLAKNLGVDCAKPDRWLVRLADIEETTVDDLCARLSRETGDRIATVDVVLWRACAAGVLLIGDGCLLEARC